jgi:Bacterial regulatory proteins, luxR family
MMKSGYEGLGISSHTVHTHLERLYHKLAVGSRAALISRIFVEYLSLRAERRRGSLALPTLRPHRSPTSQPAISHIHAPGVAWSAVSLIADCCGRGRTCWDAPAGMGVMPIESWRNS